MVTQQWWRVYTDWLLMAFGAVKERHSNDMHVCVFVCVFYWMPFCFYIAPVYSSSLLFLLKFGFTKSSFLSSSISIEIAFNNASVKTPHPKLTVLTSTVKIVCIYDLQSILYNVSIFGSLLKVTYFYLMNIFCGFWTHWWGCKQLLTSINTRRLTSHSRLSLPTCL